METARLHSSGPCGKDNDCSACLSSSAFCPDSISLLYSYTGPDLSTTVSFMHMFSNSSTGSKTSFPLSGH
ncbi:hypothetical protein EB796_002520 [Bugula neritina]|uniref:Uncharacterized protein n=1 Tax=Bugula neritina TaxID=10212 RepID=A0A7J7KLZ6_BUGNE|nr:hypothetical protein EB796_002520 [Bugula neritina]